jgi:uncharacterized membrane protein YidH (DUF202 family)
MEHYSKKKSKTDHRRDIFFRNYAIDLICNIRIRRAPTTRHDNIDFKPIVKRIANIIPLSVVTADKAYDSEDNHLLVREELGAFSVIPARHKDVPIWNTHGRYRKQMKLGYPKILYGQRNKDETIISVIKRLFGEHLMSRLIRTQNRELSLRCIAYNMHRLTNLIIILMVSTKPLLALRNYLTTRSQIEKGFYIPSNFNIFAASLSIVFLGILIIVYLFVVLPASNP